MKRLIPVLLVLALLFTATACNGGNAQGVSNNPTTESPQTADIPFTAQYIRIYGEYIGAYPETVILRSTEDLATYQEQYAEGESEFGEAIQAYDADFFGTKALIAILVEENSGSNRHKVTRLTTENGQLHIAIERDVPEVGTCDMARWSILIAADASVIPADGSAIVVEGLQDEHTFLALVKESNNGNTVTVEPLEGETERQSSSLIAISLTDSETMPEADSVIRVTYTGSIMETYPAQINALQWSTVTELRDRAYPATWLDKTTAEQYEYPLTSDFIITKIFKDCFFVEYIIPTPYVGVKFNGTLSEDWCVGDKVEITADNLYDDTERHRLEGDMQSIQPSTFEPDPDVAYKPVIYLYPETETEISVALDLHGQLTCTYPTYENGWQVTAAPDGTLTDKDGQTYNYLYWEGDIQASWDTTYGACVKGADTAAFLEMALAALGLTRREANEFIVYWLPQMQNNPYNIVTFQTEAYTDAAPLTVTPTPDTVIRVFMTYQASATPVEITPQELTAPTRHGFTVVEWGGTRLK